MRLPEQARDLLRENAPTAPVWQRRVAIPGGAVTIGLIALLFAYLADGAGERVTVLAARWWPQAVSKERLCLALSLSFLPPRAQKDHDDESAHRDDDADVPKSGRHRR